MNIGVRHWVPVGAVALMFHGALLAAFWPDKQGVARDVGRGGLQIGFGLAGGVAGVLEPVAIETPDASVVTAEITAREALPTPVEIFEPEPATTEPIQEESVETVEVAITKAVVKKAPPVKTQHPAAAQPQSRDAPPPERGEEGQKEMGTVDALDTMGTDDHAGTGGQAGTDDDYFARLQMWLEKHKKYPHIARRRGFQGTATLFFVMDRNGRILRYEVTQSSGYKSLDRAVEEMIQRAQPLPKMPAGMTGLTTTLTVPVRFFLQ